MNHCERPVLEPATDRLYRRSRSYSRGPTTVHINGCERIPAGVPVWSWLSGRSLEEVRELAKTRSWRLCKNCFPKEQPPDRSDGCEKGEAPKPAGQAD